MKYGLCVPLQSLNSLWYHGCEQGYSNRLLVSDADGNENKCNMMMVMISNGGRLND